VASLDKARVTLENLRKNHDRALELFDKSLISYEEKENSEVQYLSAEADFMSAEAKLDQAKSQLESSQVDLANTIIKSPIDGIVINRIVNVGQTVAASLQAPVLFQIANDLNKMQVECSVDEADIGKVKENQKVTFTVDAYPEESFVGTVKQVRYSPETIQNVVTYTTIVEVDNNQLKLRPGMTATVSVVVNEAANVLRVPNSALHFSPQNSTSKNKRTKGNISRIWILSESGELKPVPVKTGVKDSSYTEVYGEGLKEGQKVITGFASGTQSDPQKDNSMRNMMRAFR
jgi:HlyD family secretion protein